MNYPMQIMVDQETMNWFIDLNRSGFNVHFMNCFEASNYIEKNVINTVKLGDFIHRLEVTDQHNKRFITEECNRLDLSPEQLLKLNVFLTYQNELNPYSEVMQ
ncbi:hypothetical protein IS650_003243 [Escherichia coli]|nr:hypothetical protein [Escherichia coli]EHK5555871.1 hypothetical protein [Escherichia coli]EHK7427973.1 hypothetical protein [Escherichia coli]EHP6191600.1 hypothetical protein [Escherichia coli]EID7297006.1 hypothetical protein [Escherichia coli]